MISALEFLDREAQESDVESNTYIDDEDEDTLSVDQNDADFIDDSVVEENPANYLAARPFHGDEEPPISRRLFASTSYSKVDHPHSPSPIRDSGDFGMSSDSDEDVEYHPIVGPLRRMLEPQAFETMDDAVRRVLQPQASEKSKSESIVAVNTGLPHAELKEKMRQAVLSSQRRQQLKAWSNHPADGKQAPAMRTLRYRIDIAPGQWVEVQRGLYKRDVGVVWKPKNGPSKTVQSSTDETAAQIEGDEGYLILLVPRVGASKKRKRGDSRPPLSLFDATKSSDVETFPGDPHLHKAGGKTFAHGLLVQFFLESSLQPVSVLSPFQREAYVRKLWDHPFVRQFPVPYPDSWVFKLEEEISFDEDGPETGRKGVIVETHGDYCYIEPAGVVKPDELVAVHKRNLVKFIVPGDPVKVLSGEHMEKEGTVLHRNGYLLFISQRRGEDMAGDDTFFVHVNTVEKRPVTFSKTAIPMPWKNVEVEVVKVRGRQDGRYFGRRGVVTNVRVSRRKDKWMLLVYIPNSACTIEIEHDFVVEATSRLPLSSFEPLTPVQANRPEYRIDPIARQMHTGKVPWWDVEVLVTKSNFKGIYGRVRDVNRTRACKSGIVVSVELALSSATGTNRVEKINYEHVLDRASGQELEKAYPLPRERSFYKPWPVYKSKPLDRGGNVSSSLVPEVAPVSATPQTPLPLDQPEDLDWDNPHDPWNPHSLHPLYWANEVIEDSPQSPEPVKDDEVASDSSSLPVASTSQPSSSSHWILHPNLFGIPIRVFIRSTGKRKSQGTFVTTRMKGSETVVGYVQRGGALVDVDPRQIEIDPQRPNAQYEKGLMVVSRGVPEHIGRLVRCIHFFYNGVKGDTTRWHIVGVVNRINGKESLTGDIFEFPPADLDLVEEDKDSKALGTKLFEAARAAARTKNPSVRCPGEEDFIYLQQLIYRSW